MSNSISTQDITFCIKTIHRPWSCHRLVESIRKHIDEPNIVVVDDGVPKKRYSECYPQSAKYCNVVNLDQHDVGVGVGRNTAIEAADTVFILLLDDDHVVTPKLKLPQVCEKFAASDIDILGVRQGEGGRPLLFKPLMNGKRLSMYRGEHKRVGSVAWCDMSSNAFLARRETVANIRWDPQLKTYEHWEFFYRASHICGLKVAVETDCSVQHSRVVNSSYRQLRSRCNFRGIGLRKHGFTSMKYPAGGVVPA